MRKSRFEYCRRHNPTLVEMNELGLEGWKLVAIEGNNFYLFIRGLLNGTA